MIYKTKPKADKPPKAEKKKAKPEKPVAGMTTKEAGASLNQALSDLVGRKVEVIKPKPEPKPEAKPNGAAAPETMVIQSDGKVAIGTDTNVAPQGIAVVPPPKGKKQTEVSNINKRITEGARIDHWRTARSLRKGYKGFFAQGGHYVKTNRGNEFIVGEEKFFDSLTAAQEYAKSKLPAVG